jgi:hypothetical protein
LLANIVRKYLRSPGMGLVMPQRCSATTWLANIGCRGVTHSVCSTHHFGIPGQICRPVPENPSEQGKLPTELFNYFGWTWCRPVRCRRPARNGGGAEASTGC